jgi:hypothetical protein
MIQKVGAISFIEEVTYGNCASFQKRYLTFSQTVEIFSSAGSGSLISHINLQPFDQVNGKSVVPGIPGTQQEALSQLSAQFAAFFHRFSDLGSRFQSIAEQMLSNEPPEKRREFLDALDEARQAAQEDEAAMESADRSLAVKNEKKLKKMARFLSQPIPASGPSSSLTNLVKDIVHVRSSHGTGRIAQHEEATRRYRTFISNLQGSYPIFEARVRSLSAVLVTIQTVWQELAGDCRACATRIREGASLISHETDFPVWVHDNHVIRYDLPGTAFTPIDLSHPAFSELEPIVNMAVPPMYPLALGFVERPFVAETEREMSVREGAYVLLMDTNENEWVLVADPLTMEMGHIPSAYVAVLGTHMGVFLWVPDDGVIADDVCAQRGDYAAVMGPSEDDPSLLCVITQSGETVDVNREMLAVIS